MNYVEMFMKENNIKINDSFKILDNGELIVNETYSFDEDYYLFLTKRNQVRGVVSDYTLVNLLRGEYTIYKEV